MLFAWFKRRKRRKAVIKQLSSKPLPPLQELAFWSDALTLLTEQPPDVTALRLTRVTTTVNNFGGLIDSLYRVRNIANGIPVILRDYPRKSIFLEDWCVTEENILVSLDDIINELLKAVKILINLNQSHAAKLESGIKEQGLHLSTMRQFLIVCYGLGKTDRV